MDKGPDVTGSKSPTPAAPVPGACNRTDLHAIDDVYLEHAPLLRRVAIRKFSVPPADAENLVHDVFLDYLVSTRTVRSDLRSYLVGAICNASRNYWRSRRSESRVFTDDEASGADVLSEDIFNDLARNLIVASTLARLGERCREALRRYYLDGEDTGTVAAAMNTSPSNVNYLMHVCRKRAREVYETITRAR
jgi:RNA polymerase sigma factor (sigma-70 family)